jgi:hypothetical protein
LLACEDVLYRFKPARRAAAGGNDLVFPNTVGRPINPSNFLLPEFYPLLRDAGVPRMRFHDLRTVSRLSLLSPGAVGITSAVRA